MWICWCTHSKNKIPQCYSPIFVFTNQGKSKFLKWVHKILETWKPSARSSMGIISRKHQIATFRHRDGDCHVVQLTPEFQALQHERGQQHCHPPGCRPRIAPPRRRGMEVFWRKHITNPKILLMEEIVHHLGCIKPYK